MTILTILFLGIILSYQTSKEVEPRFPFSVELTSLDGKSVNTSKFRNDDKMVFIDFWHTGCSPCMKMFDAVRDNYNEWNQNTNCKIIAVVCEERNERIIQLIKSKKWPVEVYFDPEYLLFAELCRYHDKKDIQFSFPTVFVFNKKWQLIDKLKGAKWKFRDGFLPGKNQKVTHDDFVIDLDGYYDLFREWRVEE